MSILCPHCSASMLETAAFCPECGHPMPPAERAHGMVGVLPETLAGALAYFLLPALVFLLVEPYNKNRFVHFHSLQCVGLCLAAIVIGAALWMLGFALYFIPVLGHLIVWLLSMVLSLASFLLWVVLVVKALQGEIFKLPVVGDFAEQRSGAK